MFMVTICNCLHITFGIVVRLTIAIVRRSVLTVYKTVLLRCHDHPSLTQPSSVNDSAIGETTAHIKTQDRSCYGDDPDRISTRRATLSYLTRYASTCMYLFVLNRHRATHLCARSGSSQPTAIVLNRPRAPLLRLPQYDLTFGLNRHKTTLRRLTAQQFWLVLPVRDIRLI